MSRLREEKVNMLEMTKVTKTYRIGGQNVRALDQIDLALAGGEFVSVVGPSGAGKSTLLHLLGALDRPDAGSIRFQGREVGGLNDDQQSEFRRHSVGFVFQFFNLLPTMTAWENVAVPRLLDGGRMSKAKSRALDLLELVGLSQRAGHRPSELSGGQMQRVAVARALMYGPTPDSRGRADGESRHQDRSGNHGTAHRRRTSGWPFGRHGDPRSRCRRGDRSGDHT